MGFKLKKLIKTIANPASLVGKGKAANLIANPLEQIKLATNGQPLKAGDYFGSAGTKLDKVFGGNLRNASLFHKLFNPDIKGGSSIDPSLPGGAPDPEATTEDVIGAEVGRMKNRRASQLLFGGGPGPLTASARLFGS